MSTSKSKDGRRHFLWTIGREARLLLEELRGIPQLRLDDLEDLPEEKLREVIPELLPQFELGYRGQRVVALRGGEVAVDLFAANSPELTLLNRFDGVRSIEAIARDLPADPTAENDAYERVRLLFLRLVKAGVCAPANAVY